MATKPGARQEQTVTIDERSLQLREILAVARYRARAGIASGAMAAMIKSGEIRARLDAS